MFGSGAFVATYYGTWQKRLRIYSSTDYTTSEPTLLQASVSNTVFSPDPKIAGARDANRVSVIQTGAVFPNSTGSTEIISTNMAETY